MAEARYEVYEDGALIEERVTVRNGDAIETTITNADGMTVRVASPEEVDALEWAEVLEAPDPLDDLLDELGGTP